MMYTKKMRNRISLNLALISLALGVVILGYSYGIFLANRSHPGGWESIAATFITPYVLLAYGVNKVSRKSIILSTWALVAVNTIAFSLLFHANGLDEQDVGNIIFYPIMWWAWGLCLRTLFLVVLEKMVSDV